MGDGPWLVSGMDGWADGGKTKRRWLTRRAGGMNADCELSVCECVRVVVVFAGRARGGGGNVRMDVWKGRIIGGGARKGGRRHGIGAVWGE